MGNQDWLKYEVKDDRLIIGKKDAEEKDLPILQKGLFTNEH